MAADKSYAVIEVWIPLKDDQELTFERTLLALRDRIKIKRSWRIGSARREELEQP